MASITVKNNGAIEGKEVIQLYIHDVAASVVRPVKELKDFLKISLKPQEERRVSFKISSEDLKFYKEQYLVSESGEFEIFIGANSQDTRFSEKIFFEK